MLTDEQKQNMQKLYDALVSGEYNQANGYLCETTKQTIDGKIELEKPSYCCLGVCMKINPQLGRFEKDKFLNKDKFEYYISLPPFEALEELFGENETIVHRMGNQGDVVLKLKKEEIKQFTVNHISKICKKRTENEFKVMHHDEVSKIIEDENYEYTTFASTLNDNGYSFKEIAAIIKRNYLDENN